MGEGLESRHISKVPLVKEGGNMKKPITLFLVVLFVFILISVMRSFAEERITLTTYYPAPYGVYKEMRANQMAIGEGYRHVGLSDGTLIVSGNMGIGTSSPSTELHIRKDGNGQHPIFRLDGKFGGSDGPVGIIEFYKGKVIV